MSNHTTPHHTTPHHTTPHHTTACCTNMFIYGLHSMRNVGFSKMSLLPHHTALQLTSPHHTTLHYATLHYTTLLADIMHIMLPSIRIMKISLRINTVVVSTRTENTNVQIGSAILYSG